MASQDASLPEPFAPPYAAEDLHWPLTQPHVHLTKDLLLVSDIDDTMVSPWPHMEAGTL
jgi:hypothetical protein